MSGPVFAERLQCQTFRLNGLPYIPHYNKPNVFVAPGGLEVSKLALDVLKAQPSTHFLWERTWAVQHNLQSAK